MVDRHTGKIPDRSCRNCHFLSKYYVDRDGVSRFTWTEAERENLQIDEHGTAECRRGIWSVGIDPSFKEKLVETIKMDRKESCFFIKQQQGMTFQAAMKLYRIQNDNRQLRKSYRYTQIGLWIAAIAAAVAATDEIVSGVKWLLNLWNPPTP